MSLDDLQRDFQRFVLSGDERIERHVIGTDDVPASVRLGIYSDAYRLRLGEALASNMPRLRQLVGEQQFAQLAARYIEAHQSRFASIRWFGDVLPQMLRQSHASEPWLAELALWEWTLAAAFDARDVEPLTPAALAQIAPDDWGGMQFEFHPAARPLQLTTNAAALFKALSEDMAPPQPRLLERPQPWLVWRQALKPQYRSLDAEEAVALQAALGGATFSMLCERLCEWHGPTEVPAQAAGMLKRWVLDEIVTGVVIAQ